MQNLATTTTQDAFLENKKTYSLNRCELNIYETNASMTNVSLKFQNFSFTSMIRGRKEVRLTNKSNKFEYLPGESIVVLPGEEMTIDFPESDHQSTQSLAIAISDDFIKNTLDYLNGNMPKLDENSSWRFLNEHFYLFSSESLSYATSNLMHIVMENNSAKDFISDLALKELLIRIMQTQARSFFENNYFIFKNSNRFAAVIDFIKNNIHEKISVDTLARIAYMSKSNFFRAFKQELGMAPNAYILQERIHRAKLLLRKFAPISDTAFQT